MPEQHAFDISVMAFIFKVDSNTLKPVKMVSDEEEDGCGEDPQLRAFELGVALA